MSVSVGIALVAHQGCYLVGRRGPDGPLAGYFEFPGGKCLPDETPAACAVRECLEETGLEVEVLRLRRQIEHTYPYGQVLLHFFDCQLAPGSDPTFAHDDFRWVPRSRMAQLIFPEPNGSILAELVGPEVQ